MARMVFQEEEGPPETIKAAACAFCSLSGKLMFVLYFSFYTLLWGEGKECCRVQICQPFRFLFLLRNRHTCSFSLTLFPPNRSGSDYLVFFSPLLLFLSQFCFGIMVVTYFFHNFSFSFLFASFHSIKKKRSCTIPVEWGKCLCGV